MFFGSTLPSGQSETGVWALGSGSSTSGLAATGFRFYPPLAAPIDSGHAIYAGSAATHCPGAGHADPGYLCIYAETEHNMTFNSIGDGEGTSGASTTGFLLFFNVTGFSNYAYGHWTITAP